MTSSTTVSVSLPGNTPPAFPQAFTANITSFSPDQGESKAIVYQSPATRRIMANGTEGASGPWYSLQEFAKPGGPRTTHEWAMFFGPQGTECDCNLVANEYAGTFPDWGNKTQPELVGVEIKNGVNTSHWRQTGGTYDWVRVDAWFETAGSADDRDYGDHDVDNYDRLVSWRWTDLQDPKETYETMDVDFIVEGEPPDWAWELPHACTLPSVKCQ
jgi:hypothetical protein